MTAMMTADIVLCWRSGEQLDNISAAAVTAEVPEGYYVDSIGADGKPVFKEIEKTEEQKKLEDLQAQIDALNESTLGLMDMVNGTGA